MSALGCLFEWMCISSETEARHVALLAECQMYARDRSYFEIAVDRFVVTDGRRRLCLVALMHPTKPVEVAS